jgi:hypothetical protein
MKLRIVQLLSDYFMIRLRGELLVEELLSKFARAGLMQSVRGLPVNKVNYKFT